MKKFFLLIYFIPVVGFPNGKDSIPIPVIEISDSNFYNLLDSVLELDKSCNYFSETLSYSVFIYDTVYYDLPFYFLTFTGSPDMAYFLTFFDVFKPIGAIKYNHHYFFIQNNSQLFENELVLTSKKYLFDGTLKGKYEIMDDDSWAMRSFGYHNGVFYYLGSANDDIRCK